MHSSHAHYYRRIRFSKAGAIDGLRFGGHGEALLMGGPVDEAAGEATPGPHAADRDERAYALAICWPCLALPGMIVLALLLLVPIGLLAVQSLGRDGRNGEIHYALDPGNYIGIL